MSALDLPYLSGQGEGSAGPLGRYLPPVPPGVIPAWLNQHVPEGSWVLDPFGTSPRVALEIAQAGYRLLVAANNPVVRFMLEVLASGASAADFNAALADLAASRKGEERLELHIRSLYATNCERCGKTVEAEAFLWERQSDAPYARVYTCPSCGDSGEHPITDSDQQRLASLPPASLHKARALERVIAPDDPTRADVETAVNCYLSRPLYVVFTLINKLDGPGINPARHALLTALLLSAFDDANTLWPHPTGRSRPRQLNVPPHFRENNLWMALEQAVTKWADVSRAVPLATWPEKASAGGITLLPGRFRDYLQSAGEIPIQAVVSAFPRPNQALWTLSALWTGWLWGRDAVAPLKSVLSRRRYDWNWHAYALQTTFNHLSGLLPPGIPFFGLVTEAEPSFVTAVLLAAGTSRFSLQGIALRGEHAVVQVQLQTEKDTPRAPIAPVESLSKWAIHRYLKERGEPSLYLPAYIAAVTSLAHENAFQLSGQQTPADLLPQVQSVLKRVFTDRMVLVRYGGTESAPETGYWWLREPDGANGSLMDRIEIEIVHLLHHAPGRSLAEIDAHLCAKFPGLYTPNLELILTCLDSYGDQDPPHSGGWLLRPEDRPEIRRQDLKTAQAQIHEIGARLGFHTEGESPVVWRDSNSQVHSVYYPSASSLIGKFVYQTDYDPKICHIVLPGGRSNLIAVKLRRNPRLSQAVNSGWRFIKFRSLREAVERPDLSIEQWNGQLERDPLEYRAAPMELFRHL